MRDVRGEMEPGGNFFASKIYHFNHFVLITKLDRNELLTKLNHSTATSLLGFPRSPVPS